MKPSACPRSFEVEALRDGRLTGTERTSFERHLTSCSACAHETRALDALANALRANHEHEPAGADELHVRRERTRLLAAWDHSLIAGESRWPARRRLLWPAAIAAVVASLFVFWRIRPMPQTLHATNVVIRAEGGAARWTRHTDGNRDQVVLERGTLQIQVARAPGDPPFLVVLPDGELEDTGTIFTVAAEQGHTTRVSVDEGSVVLRLRGRSAITLRAGSTWTAEPVPATAPSETPAFSGARAPSARPAFSGARAPSAPSAPLPAPRASALAPNPADDFRAAMAALNGGQCREAAAQFARFLDKHPREPRAEDAAYLRVIALQRCGAQASMKTAAREYLRRYPAGFRRAEIEALEADPSE